MHLSEVVPQSKAIIYEVIFISLQIMKKLFLLLFILILVLTVNVFSDSSPVISAGVYIQDDYSLNYRYYIPDDADKKTYPVVLYLHTAGERGHDNISQLNYGLPLLLFNFGLIDSYPAIYIFPQIDIDERWVDVDWEAGVYSVAEIAETKYLRAALALTLSAAEKYNGDLNRLYVTGISMGGYGTWDIIARHPDVFAAAVPICGGADPQAADAISHTPLRSYHGDIDYVVPLEGELQVREQLLKTDADAVITVIPGGDHFNIWNFAYEDSLDWMFSQVKETNDSELQDTAIHVDESHSKIVAVAAIVSGIAILVMCSFIAYKLFYLLALHYLNKRK